MRDCTIFQFLKNFIFSSLLTFAFSTSAKTEVSNESRFEFHAFSKLIIPTKIAKSDVLSLLKKKQKMASVSNESAASIPNTCHALLERKEKMKNLTSIDVLGGKFSEQDFVRSYIDCFALNYLRGLEPVTSKVWERGLMDFNPIKNLPSKLLPGKLNTGKTGAWTIQPVKNSPYIIRIEESDPSGDLAQISLIAAGIDEYKYTHYILAYDTSGKTSNFSDCWIYIVTEEFETKMREVIALHKVGRCG